MFYLEDLSFTAEDLAKPIDIKETAAYKNLKKYIRDAYIQRRNYISIFPTFWGTVEEEAAQQLRTEGFEIEFIKSAENPQYGIIIRW